MKKIKLILFSCIISLLFITNAKAADANISVYANKSLVIVGDTVTVTVKLNSGSNLGSWNFDVVPSSNLQMVSSSFGGLYIKDVVHTKGEKSKTYTFKFRAKSSGTGSISIKNARVIDYDEHNMSVNSGSTSFRMKTRSELEASYSKNNNLQSITVDGHDLNPSFNKDTLEYNLDLEYGTKSINVKASAEDKYASIQGVGEITLAQGMNSIRIIVTAQNGSTKTYIINANVKELDPINVQVDGKNQSIIREKQFMPQTNIHFQESTIEIDGKEVPAYKNEISGFTLVGLKDETGNTKLYIYENGNYKEYNDYSFNSLVIYLLDMPNELLPKGYTKKTIQIGEKEATAYVNPNNEFPIVYGMNLETGNKNIYKYDSKENTLQRYENAQVKNEKIYFNMMIGMVGFIVISYIGFIYTNKKNKHNFVTDSINMDIEQISADPINEILNIKSKKELKKQKKLARKKAKHKTKEENMAEL